MRASPFTQRILWARQPTSPAGSSFGDQIVKNIRQELDPRAAAGLLQRDAVRVERGDLRSSGLFTFHPDPVGGGGAGRADGDARPDDVAGALTLEAHGVPGALARPGAPGSRSRASVQPH